MKDTNNVVFIDFAEFAANRKIQQRLSFRRLVWFFHLWIATCEGDDAEIQHLNANAPLKQKLPTKVQEAIKRGNGVDDAIQSFTTPRKRPSVYAKYVDYMRSFADYMAGYTCFQKKNISGPYIDALDRRVDGSISY